ncbi:MAG: hypothetical protein ABIK83_14125 [Candidatus Zixiibacteriota bacterium]
MARAASYRVLPQKPSIYGSVIVFLTFLFCYNPAYCKTPKRPFATSGWVLKLDFLPGYGFDAFGRRFSLEDKTTFATALNLGGIYAMYLVKGFGVAFVLNGVRTSATAATETSDERLRGRNKYAGSITDFFSLAVGGVYDCKYFNATILYRWSTYRSRTHLSPSKMSWISSDSFDTTGFFITFTVYYPRYIGVLFGRAPIRLGLQIALDLPLSGMTALWRKDLWHTSTTFSLVFVFDFNREYKRRRRF